MLSITLSSIQSRVSPAFLNPNLTLTITLNYYDITRRSSFVFATDRGFDSLFSRAKFARSSISSGQGIRLNSLLMVTSMIQLFLPLTFLQLGLAKPPRVLKQSQKFNKFILNSGYSVQNSEKRNSDSNRPVNGHLYNLFWVYLDVLFNSWIERLDWI
jgi:hypothetical protein